MKKILGGLLFLTFLGSACSSKDKVPPLFEEIAAESSGVSFKNDLTFDEAFNVFTYRNFYNGGGVAIGDVNNDGLADLYFTANLVSCAESLIVWKKWSASSIGIKTRSIMDFPAIFT